jgi:hypothetical protein
MSLAENASSLNVASTHRSDEDEQGLEHLYVLREQVQSEVDEDEVLGQLSEHGEHVFGRPLRTARHGVVSVMFQGDTAEEQ